jgi:hypothetical protein
MYRRDYVLRLIERFGRMLIGLRNRLLRRETEGLEAQAQIDDVARQAGLDLDIARRLDPESLLLWLAPGDDVDQPRLWLAGELLYLTALDCEAAGRDGRGDLRRALALFQRLPDEWKPSDEFATAGERVVEIRTLLHAGRGGV